MQRVSPLKFAAGIAATIALRMVQAVPNVEPIMAMSTPYAKAYGSAAGFAFALISLVSFDFISGRLGMWTVYCGAAYGAVGFFAAKFLANRGGRMHYAAYAAVATVAYDAFTALVPFTLYHLAGNVTLAAVVSPLIFNNVLASPGKEVSVNADKVVH
jgi:hypothetical protein